MHKSVRIYEGHELSNNAKTQLETEQSLPLDEGVMLPAVIINRHQPARFTDGQSIYGVNATYIEGFDVDGQYVSGRSLQERTSTLGKLWQHSLEKWKLRRVTKSIRALGENAVSQEVQEVSLR